jgi:hypothetical protein
LIKEAFIDYSTGKKEIIITTGKAVSVPLIGLFFGL